MRSLDLGGLGRILHLGGRWRERVGSRFRGSRFRGSRFGGGIAGGPGGLGVDGPDGGPDGQVGSLGLSDVQDAGCGRRELLGDLVGLDLHEQFVLLDPVALGAMPSTEPDFGDRFAEAWDDDVDGHGGGAPGSAACDACGIDADGFHHESMLFGGMYLRGSDGR